MIDWSGKDLCFECAKRLDAKFNIGRQIKGRCHRCHSEQTLFRIIEVPLRPISGEVCPECAHPVGTHAASCRRSELEILKKEREEIVRVLKKFVVCDPDQSLADQLTKILSAGEKKPGENQE